MTDFCLKESTIWGGLGVEGLTFFHIWTCWQILTFQGACSDPWVYCLRALHWLGVGAAQKQPYTLVLQISGAVVDNLNGADRQWRWQYISDDIPGDADALYTSCVFQRHCNWEWGLGWPCVGRDVGMKVGMEPTVGHAEWWSLLLGCSRTPLAVLQRPGRDFLLTVSHKPLLGTYLHYVKP